MLAFTERMYDVEIDNTQEALLVADIGGTNSNFGVLQQRNGHYHLLISLHVKSQEIDDFPAVFNDVLNYICTKWHLKITQACIAAAGVVSEQRDYCKPTNLHFSINVHDILQATGLKCIILLNDFEVIGYGIPLVEEKSLICVYEGSERKHAQKAIIGAGTGLGKSILYWNDYVERYVALPSEGGHADCSVQTQLELDLIEFIRKKEARTCNISWEDVLSGNGIQRMYAFFKSRNNNVTSHKHLSKNGLHPDEIFNSRNLDPHARATYELYARLYARCVKCFALDALALAGVYIAGGIAAHNVAMFKEPYFIDEFLNCGKQHELLASIPLYVIADYDVSLYGAAEYMRLEAPCSVVCNDK